MVRWELLDPTPPSSIEPLRAGSLLPGIRSAAPPTFQGSGVPHSDAETGNSYFSNTTLGEKKWIGFLTNCPKS